MKVRFLEGARKDITDAENWFEAEEAGLGSRFVDKVEDAVSQIMQHPMMGTPANETLRILHLRGFPYSVVYAVKTVANEILIVSIAHQSRKPGFWLGRMRNLPES
jgi:plasmid stabilization system protein ParE